MKKRNMVKHLLCAVIAVGFLLKVFGHLNLMNDFISGVGKKNKYNGYEVHGRLSAHYH
jgi:hypothetical protein